MKLTTLTIVPVAAVLVVICICDGMPHGNNGNNNSNEESNGNSGNANRESFKTSDVKKKLKGFVSIYLFIHFFVKVLIVSFTYYAGVLLVE